MTETPQTPPAPEGAAPPAENAKPIITHEESKPCGCHFTYFSDKTFDVDPCVPHGLNEVGRAMSAAGDMLAKVARRIVEEQRANMMRQVTDAIARKGEKKGPGGIVVSGG